MRYLGRSLCVCVCAHVCMHVCVCARARVCVHMCGRLVLLVCVASLCYTLIIVEIVPIEVSGAS